MTLPAGPPGHKPSHFFTSLLRELNNRNIRHTVIGGRAAIHYKLAEFTKDYDLSVSSDAGNELVDILSTLPKPVVRVSYRLGLSAPLSQVWGAKGWTSHVEITSHSEQKGGETDRLDLFLSLPRVASTLTEVTPHYHLHTLAETKKTQREKDWSFVEAFGRKILEAGNPSGFIHLFDANYLREMMKRGRKPSEGVLTLRPSLMTLIKGDPKLELALLVEKTFWQKYDRERLSLYRGMGKQYWSNVRLAAPEMVGQSLAVQHERLLGIAQEHLPRDPFGETSVRDVTQKIVSSLQGSFSPQALEYIPNLDAICHADGVYHPQEAYE
jgi:hypothetical protein